MSPYLLKMIMAGYIVRFREYFPKAGKIVIGTSKRIEVTISYKHWTANANIDPRDLHNLDNMLTEMKARVDIAGNLKRW